MALHFVQIERAFVEGPALSDAASSLGISEDEVLGKVVRGLSWSLEHAAPKGEVQGKDPTRAVERASGWLGKRGAFVAALPDLFEATDSRVRFRGWEERYGRKLSSQEKDAARKAGKRATKSTRMSEGCPTDSPADVQRMSSGQSEGRLTDIQRMSEGGEEGRPKDGPLDHLSLLSSSYSSSYLKDSTTPLPVERAAATSPTERFASWDEFLAWWQLERIQGGFVAESPPHPRAGGAWFSAFMAELNGDVERMEATVLAFVRDPYWRQKKSPLSVLMRKWREYVPRKAGSG